MAVTMIKTVVLVAIRPLRLIGRVEFSRWRIYSYRPIPWRSHAATAGVLRLGRSTSIHRITSDPVKDVGVAVLCLHPAALVARGHRRLALGVRVRCRRRSAR